MKTTLVIGASENPDRYSNKVILRLLTMGIPVKAIGIKEGSVNGLPILTGKPPLSDIDTVTLYLGAGKQREYYDYILGLQPRRIIFNPGAENEEFEKIAEAKGIEALQACSLVMISTGSF